MSDAEAMRYWSTLPHATLAVTEDFIARTIDMCQSGESDDFAVIHDGALIGKAGLWSGNELGFIFSRRVWGKGLAREAIAAVIARGFAHGHRTIWADVDPRNARALALLDRFGFVKTGEAQRTFLIGTDWVDSVYLELHAAV
jgi:RimJ/RimL family protein N-acetyltransferase